MPAFPDNPLWDFSVAVYGRDGVKDACLALQDRHGLDVNMLLFCCWLAAEGHAPLPDTQLAAAIARIRVWHTDVVAKLRAVRRRVTDGVPRAPEAPTQALREQILALELDGERIEQHMLADAAPKAPDRPVSAQQRPAMAAENLARYCVLAEIPPGAADIDRLVTIVMAVFPAAERDELTRLIAHASA